MASDLVSRVIGLDRWKIQGNLSGKRGVERLASEERFAGGQERGGAEARGEEGSQFHHQPAPRDALRPGEQVGALLPITTVNGTHRGEMMGLAPTGKRIQTSGIDVFHREGGKLAEHWATFDALGMLRQIGMVPVPSPPWLARTLAYQARKRPPAARGSGS